MERLSMSNAFAVPATLLALSTLAPVFAARGDEENRAHVTIRGTGNNVAIERSEARIRKPFSEAVAIVPSLLDEAIRMKAQGASDGSVISYLRAHQTDLPTIIGAEDVKRLRKAGAGKSVVAYLTTLAAVDIGVTGEAPEAAVSAPPIPATDLETPYGVSGYPVFGGYGAPRPSRFSRRGFPHMRRMGWTSRPPFPHRPTGSRATFSRRLPGG